jgi:hypothetical protein
MAETPEGIRELDEDLYRGVFIVLCMEGDETEKAHMYS